MGARLRELRAEANLTARALAATCQWHFTKISKIEHGAQAPSEHDIKTWCRACNAQAQIPDLIATVRAIDSMYIEWQRHMRAGLKNSQTSSVPLYERTNIFRVYENTVMPGLFHTAEYAAAIFRFWNQVPGHTLRRRRRRCRCPHATTTRPLHRTPAVFLRTRRTNPLHPRRRHRHNGRTTRPPPSRDVAITRKPRHHPSIRPTPLPHPRKLLDIRRTTSKSRRSLRQTRHHPTPRNSRTHQSIRPTPKIRTPRTPSTPTHPPRTHRTTTNMIPTKYKAGSSEVDERRRCRGTSCTSCQAKFPEGRSVRPLIE